MSEKFSQFEKISQKTQSSIFEVIDRLRHELDINIDIKETPDIITVVFENESGIKKEMGFTKMGDKIMVGKDYYDLEKVIEARIRFPDDSVLEAVQKNKNLKNKGV